MLPDAVDWTLVTAFLSGVAAVVSSVFAIRGIRRRADADCERRLEALREGFKMGRE